MEYGPVGKEELREWIQENRIGLETVVRPDEPDSSWQHWQAHADLVALLAEVQSAAPGTIRPGLVAGNLISRILAFGMDVILCFFLCSPVLFLLSPIIQPDLPAQVMAAAQSNHPFSYRFDQPDHPAVGLILLGVFIFYMAGFHAVHGQTPGKSLMRLKVVDESGNKPAFTACLVRGMVTMASFFLYGLPMAYAFFNPQRRTLHDFIAKTFVVKK